MVRSLLSFIGAASVVFAQASAQQFGILPLDGRNIPFEAQDGYAVTHGDIILGTLAEVQRAASGDETELLKLRRSVVTDTGRNLLWSNATMFYAIDPDVPNPSRILRAIDHWNTRTPLQILPRTGEVNYVRFVRSSSGTTCSSQLGMRGGEQVVSTGDGCTAGVMIHEIGHAWGLLHEQERTDRNAYVTVLYDNIDRRNASQFDNLPVSRDVSYYDYDSIMHYQATAFSRNGRTSIDTVPLGIPIGQITVLSAGDIDSVSRLYGFKPEQTTITTIPAGLPMVVDGVPATSPQSYSWSAGSSHTVEVPELQGSDPQYRFIRWSDGGAASHTLQASADRTVFAATFQRRHRLSTIIGAGQGTIAVKPESPDGYYPERAQIQLAPIPGPGNEFLSWGGTVNLQSQFYGLATTNPVIEVLRADSVVSASFTSAPTATIDSDPPGRVVIVDGSSYYTPVKFRWTPGSNHTISAPGPQDSPSGTTRYQFIGWEDGSSTPTRSVTAGSDAVTFTAGFQRQFELDVFVFGQGSVSVTPTSPDGFYDEGTEVQLVATPRSGQSVRYWVMDTKGGGTGKSLSMDQAKAAGAYFGVRLFGQVVNAASYAPSPFPNLPGSAIAPLEILTVFGDNVGPGSPSSGTLDGNGRLTTQAGGTRVLFDGVPAPLLYASGNQTSVVAPANLAGKTEVEIVVERNGMSGQSVIYGVVPTVPALFTANATGTGPVAALNEDGSVNSASNPAAAGSVVVLFATGAGAMDRAVPDGSVIRTDLLHPTDPVSVRFEKLDGQILYAGSAPSFVNGALQVNVRIPSEQLGGEVPVQLVVGPYTSPAGVTIFVR